MQERQFHGRPVETGGDVSDAAADARGCVTVRLDAEGVPDSIRVDASWRQRVPAAELGACVVEAARAASLVRTERLMRGFADAGGLERMRAQGSAAPADPPAQLTDHQVGGRRLQLIVEDALAAMDSVDVRLRAVAPRNGWTGEAAGGSVSLSVSRTALLACAIESHWAERQSDGSLTEALGSALRGARSDLAHAVETDLAAPARVAGGLLDELMSLLHNPQLLSES